MDMVCQSIYTGNWNLKELKPSGSEYIERILHNMTEVREKINYIGGGSIPKYIHTIFFQFVIRAICFNFVDSYSRVKKVPTAA